MEIKNTPFNKYSEQILEKLDEWQFIERFGWTLEEIRRMDEEDKSWLKVLMTGISRGETELSNKK